MILLYILYALCPEQYKQIYCMRLLSSVISDKRQMHKKAIYVLNYLFTLEYRIIVNDFIAFIRFFFH